MKDIGREEIARRKDKENNLGWEV